MLRGLVLILLMGCGSGGGGGAGASGPRVSLIDVAFPDPADQSDGGDWRPPNNASLIQRIELRFSDRVDAEDVTSSGIDLRDAETRAQVAADYEVDGATVVVHPSLPIRPIANLGGDHWDLGGAALAPHTIYELTVPLATAGAMPTLASIAPDLFARYDFEAPTPNGKIGRNFAAGTRAGTFSVRWRTTANPNRFLTGYEPSVPSLVLVAPLDGSEQLSPKLFTDPERRFPEFSPYRLVFDRPLDPAADNVGDDTFELIGLADEHGDPPAYARLGVYARILTNRYDRCEVEVVPSGVLPFGHRLGLRVARSLRQISGGAAAGGAEIVSEFTIAGAGEQAPLHDVMRETFADTTRQETSRTELEGRTPADWNRNDSHHLQSAFGFQGGGELGPFLPLAPRSGTRTMVLDTNQQGFPLLDGSTPGAPAGLTVYGGVFNFTDVVVPAGVRITAVGRNPLVMTATGSVSIAGVIDVGGRAGTSDNTYNSAIFPIGGGVGGPAGGRGGESHPTIVEGPFTYMNFLPPRVAQAGEGPTVRDGRLVFDLIGGGAGQCGINDSPPLDCGTQTGNKATAPAAAAGRSSRAAIPAWMASATAPRPALRRRAQSRCSVKTQGTSAARRDRTCSRTRMPTTTSSAPRARCSSPWAGRAAAAPAAGSTATSARSRTGRRPRPTCAAAAAAAAPARS
ncbi:MAG: Ig-like domain-containing protein [Planctomycetota bacterium]